MSREENIAKARAEVEATVRENKEILHRAIDARYNLLRVSERRWAVVREAHVSKQMLGIPDVVTFEIVEKPLALDAALQLLRQKREKR